MKIDWLLHRALDKLSGKAKAVGRTSFSQCGEDMIVRFIFDALRLPAPSYLDIGAHHPTYLNNTFNFYQSGARGVNVEPDPNLMQAFTNKRQRDINLNVGIAESDGELEFYVMSVRTLNTFSAADAHAAVKEGKTKIDRVIRVPVTPINNILARHFSCAKLDFVSLDVEGLDLQILQSFDFNQWRPKVLCVETITYSEGRTGKKIPKIEQTLLDRDYFRFADTHINSIFVDRSVW